MKDNLANQTTPPYPPLQAAELKPGSVVVTFTKGLESACFEVVNKKRFEMSWGEESRDYLSSTCPTLISILQYHEFRIPFSLVSIPSSAFDVLYSVGMLIWLDFAAKF